MTPEQTQQIMWHHARSFAPAARLLPKHERQKLAMLYALCRMVDDLADEDKSPTASARLAKIVMELRLHTGTDPISREAIMLFKDHPTGLAAFAALVAGVRRDIDPVAISSLSELDAYCHAVAGTVGIMICELFEVSPAYHSKAAALGRAMQLTNICRDVLEDAENQRRYLPAELCDASPEEIIAADKAVRSKVSQAVQKLLMRAEDLYQEGALGYPALPWRLRLAVAAAAGMYRGIGRRLQAQDADPLGGRVQLSVMRKAAAAVLALLRASAPRRGGAKEAQNA